MNEKRRTFGEKLSLVCVFRPNSNGISGYSFDYQKRQGTNLVSEMK